MKNYLFLFFTLLTNSLLFSQIDSIKKLVTSPTHQFQVGSHKDYVVCNFYNIEFSKIKKFDPELSFVIIGSKSNQNDTSSIIIYFKDMSSRINYLTKAGIPIAEIDNVELLAVKELKDMKISDKSSSEEIEKYNLKLFEKTKLFRDIITSQRSLDLTETKSRGILSCFHHNSYCNGSCIPVVGFIGIPFFISSSNNNSISSYKIALGTTVVGSYVSLFDKTYYRNRIFSAWSWTGVCVNLPANANDKTSSLLVF